jgi:flavin-dependent dehydrogenase
MSPQADIVVLGGGPAAVATACRLRRLGHGVQLIGLARGAAVEGLSWRTLELLRAGGLNEAAESASGAGARSGTWAGTPVPQSMEYVLDRSVFGAALMRDAQTCGVPVRAERVVRVAAAAGRWRVQTVSDAVDCDVVVDARGRRVQRIRERGPGLVAVGQRLRLGASSGVFTRVHALVHGWCWIASDGRGMGWLQSTVSSRDARLRDGLARHMAECLAAVSARNAELGAAVAVGVPVARASSATWAARSAQPGFLAIGDAQVAIDPLCGHGIYEALRAAELAGAAVHSLLEGVEWPLVERFLAERVASLWRRRNAAAAEFYGRQAQFTPSEFWRASARRYETLSAAGAAQTPCTPGVERRPVLNGNAIEERAVVVTEQFPRGVWQVGRVDVVRLLELAGRSSRLDVRDLAQRLDRPVAAVSGALKWLQTAGVLGEEALSPRTPGGERTVSVSW